MGAGASLGGRSASSQPLPTGAEFATEIISALGLNVAAGTPLPYVWDAAALRVGGEAEMVRRFIGPRFHKCVPAPQHLRIATFAWSRIYTFNVDDVLEGAYATEKGRLQTLRIVHFDHQYSEAEADQDQLQLVYLHGAASFPNEPIVFGPPAYAAAATRQHTWWHVLADTFLTQPVIVVGASLREPDFEAYLATKRRSPAPLAATSYFVAPNVDDAVSATCSRLGLVPVRATMTDFLERLAALVPDRVPLSVLNARQISDQGLIDVLQSKPLLSVVARQYVLVGQPDGWPMSDRPPEAFYEGYDPVWEDLRARRDIELQVELRTLAWIQEFQSTPSSRLACICLTGTAGTGKTTALMRLAIGLSEASLRVLYFIAHDRLRDDVLSRVAETLQNELIVVVVDDIASHVEQLRRFMERHRPSDARTVILGAVRSSRKHAVAYHLDDIVPVRFAEMGRLTHDEGLALAKRLRGASKLAQLANHTDAQLATTCLSACFSTPQGVGLAGGQAAFPEEPPAVPGAVRQ